MIKKPYIFAIILMVTAVLFSACILEYDFDMEGPWVCEDGYRITYRRNATGTADGFGGDVVVTLNLSDGVIVDLEIDMRHETESWIRELRHSAPINVQMLNGFGFLDRMSGPTVTARAIREAGEIALRAAGAHF